jgi:hypothetical protein
MNTITLIASKIIMEQALIIGPIAWTEAAKVRGIKIINQASGTLEINEPDGRSVIDKLVQKFEQIFGQASREVCKEAAASLVADLSPSEVPASLR